MRYTAKKRPYRCVLLNSPAPLRSKNIQSRWDIEYKLSLGNENDKKSCFLLLCPNRTQGRSIHVLSGNRSNVAPKRSRGRPRQVVIVWGLKYAWTELGHTPMNSKVIIFIEQLYLPIIMNFNKIFHRAEWVDIINYSWPPKRQIRMHERFE